MGVEASVLKSSPEGGHSYLLRIPVQCNEIIKDHNACPTLADSVCRSAKQLMSVRSKHVKMRAHDLSSCDCALNPQLSPLKFTDLHVLLCFLQQYCFKHPDIDQQLQAVSVEFGRLLLPAACGAGDGAVL